MSQDNSTVTYRDIPEFNGYRVGDDGSVWSIWARRANRGGGTRFEMGAVWNRLKTSLREGYPSLTLTRNTGTPLGERRSCSVHQLVMLAFVGPCPDGMEVAHENGVKTDNRLSNLSYKTPAQNQQDRVRHGTDSRGEKNRNSRLTSDAVRECREECASGRRTRTEMAQKYGVSPVAVQSAVQGKTWRHIAGETLRGRWRVSDAAVAVLRIAGKTAVCCDDAELLDTIAGRMKWPERGESASRRVLKALAKKHGILQRKLAHVVGRKRPVLVFSLPNELINEPV